MVLWDINAKGLETVAQEIRTALAQQQTSSAAATANTTAAAAGAAPAGSNNVYTYVCDVSDSKNVYTMAERVKSEVGDVDCLINNAGVVSGRFVEEVSDDAIRRTFGVNTLALFWTVRAFLPGVRVTPPSACQ